MKPDIKSGRLTATIKVRLPSDQSGWGDNKRTREPFDAEVRLVICLEDLAYRLAYRASRNASRKSAALNGNIKANLLTEPPPFVKENP